MQEIILPEKFKRINGEGNFGVFEIKPCYPGYGSTIGNSFRRVLLSSLRGSAAYAIKIKGINHEFSTVPGVLEDIVEIILNVKKIRFNLFEEDFGLYDEGEKEGKRKQLESISDEKDEK